MDLPQINQAACLEEKSYLKLQDLTPEHPYPIRGMTIVNSKFGEVARVEMDKNITFLPQRATDSIKQNIQHFEAGKFGLKFKGMRDIKGLNPTPIFKVVELVNGIEKTSKRINKIKT